MTLKLQTAPKTKMNLKKGRSQNNDELRKLGNANNEFNLKNEDYPK